MRKGITPVIAIILLLLITISMVGFAFVWFNRMTANITQTTSEQTYQQTQAMGKKVSIDTASASGIYIRNIGTVSLTPATEISVYEGGALEACTWVACSSMAPGAVCACGTTCTPGSTVRATAPGNYDEVTCS